GGLAHRQARRFARGRCHGRERAPARTRHHRPAQARTGVGALPARTARRSLRRHPPAGGQRHLRMSRPRLALVPGEPAGVGPELCVRAIQHGHDANLTAFGDGRSLLAAAEALRLPLTLAPAGAESRPGVLPLVEIPAAVATCFGTPEPANAASTIAALERAGAACLRGDFQGVVTGPVHKAAINAGGIAYTGTTGLLAAQAGCDVVMMLANDVVRVALATTHLPLREVADAITADGLTATLRILHASLRREF